MEILNYLYENPPIFQNNIARKIKINNSKALICGQLNSGKSQILLNLLFKNQKDEILYINLDDLRLNFDETDFLKFLNLNKKIKFIGIDNLKTNDSKLLKIIENLSYSNTNIENIYLTTRQKSLNLNGFKKYNLNMLDFEEFIALEGKTNDLGAIFSEFLTRGNSINDKISIQNNLKANYNENELLILLECAKFVNQNFSTNKIYTNLKEFYKISKDKVYEAVFRLEDEGIIKFVPKFKSTSKRIYFGDFAFMDNLSYKKHFIKKLQNALLCELLTLDKEIYFTDDFDFYLPNKNLQNQNLAFLIIPFTTSEFIYLKFKKLFEQLKKMRISKLYAITMGNEESFTIEGIKCEITPFWQYALSI